MNKIKGVLVLALVFVLAAPCFGGEAAIKRKKNKWISCVEQNELYRSNQPVLIDEIHS